MTNIVITHGRSDAMLVTFLAVGWEENGFKIARLAGLSVGKLFYIEVLLGERDLDLVLVELLINLLMKVIQYTPTKYWLFDPAE